jgi:hypothetical protein
MREPGESSERPNESPTSETPSDGVPRNTRRPPSASSPILIFVGALLLSGVTFGSSVALMTRNAGLGSTADAPTVTLAPARSPTPAPTPVRIAASNGTAERLESGAYRVTFSWTLEGAREGDSAQLRFSVGNRIVTEQRGTLDPTVFTASTGRLVITTSQDCSAEGWSAEVVTVRGLAPVGEAISRAPAASCG